MTAFWVVTAATGYVVVGLAVTLWAVTSVGRTMSWRGNARCIAWWPYFVVKAHTDALSERIGRKP